MMKKGTGTKTKGDKNSDEWERFGLKTRLKMKQEIEQKRKEEEDKKEYDNIKMREQKKLSWKTIKSVEEKNFVLEKEYSSTTNRNKKKKIGITIDIYEKRAKAINILRCMREGTMQKTKIPTQYLRTNMKMMMSK